MVLRSGSRLVVGVLLGAVAVVAVAVAWAADSAAEVTVAHSDASPLFPPLPQAPLAGKLVLTGSFGEHRNSHIHAGLDISTGGEVGRPVLAPASGFIERIRASGAGYGRSIYLHADDGRLLVLAHLEAFEEPWASYVALVQDSSGRYEQDLWPERERFRIRAGDRLGWSGRSGTGTPHLHFEIRRGDMALNPMRAGIDVADVAAPELRSFTLEPLDQQSFVNHSAAPFTTRFGGRADTLVLEGRARAVVDAVDPGERGAEMAPWGVGVEWRGMHYEWRADSISWATDLAEVDYVYDLGRAVPFSKTTLRMWAAAGVRPRMSHTNAPVAGAAGVIEARPEDPARPLRVLARDLAGHVTTREVWIRGPREGERVRETPLFVLDERLEADPLPNGRLRLESHEGDSTWVGVANANDPEGGGDRSPVLSMGLIRSGVLDGFAAWTVDSAAVFEPTAWTIRRETHAHGAPAELRQASAVLAILPMRPPLRRAIRLAMVRPSNESSLAIYRKGDDGWEFSGADLDPATNHVSIQTRRLGRFAIFADTLAPRITDAVPSRDPVARGYPQWTLTSRLVDDGAGVAALETWFIVDGVRRPAEWDAVRNELRWRPMRAPARGTHRYEVVATDRAGNVARRAGTFVVREGS
jgi:murein DD-endopeptidase MepM/ murein hydrolase activator NlpD